MSKKEKQYLENEDILDQMEDEIEEIENDDGSINEDKLEDTMNPEDEEDEKCMDKLVKIQADFANFKARVDRDRTDMIFFLKQDIFKKILPVLDDLDRIIKSSSEEDKKTPIYEWAIALHKKLNLDLEKMWVKPFLSVWEEADPDKHEVMTRVPWKKENIICDEFEKWYLLDGRVLRYAKVVVWAWD